MELEGPDSNIKNYVWGLEHAQRQIICVGCKPAIGYYEQWNPATNVFFRGTDPLEDGVIHEFGYGNHWAGDSPDETVVPLEMLAGSDQEEKEKNFTYCLDKIGMDNDNTGDSNFLIIERQAEGVRHTLSAGNHDAEFTAGTTGDYKNVTSSADPLCAKTAGMVSNTTDIFNKSYWLNKAKGVNNGILWGNKLYITFVDNMRGFIYRRNEAKTTGDNSYDPTKIQYRLRHIKEYQVSVIVRKCTVKLEAKLITSLLQLNKEWLANLGFKFNTPTAESLLHQNGIFRTVSDIVKIPEEELKDTAEDIKCVVIDCNGSAQMKNVHHSSHILARHYREVGNVEKEEPKRPIKRKAKPSQQ